MRYCFIHKSYTTTVKIFQFLHSLYCTSGQYMLCRKEKLIAREYSIMIRIENECISNVFQLINKNPAGLGLPEHLQDFFVGITFSWQSNKCKKKKKVESQYSFAV